ncbi:MAG: hypothetical protein IKP31_06030 [Lachnospiraceae bacterium]|nr:hypothetical protein [Lachnospiraceae bacterium]
MSDKKISLNHEELNKVIGGYIEDDIGRDTLGKEVKCPKCHHFLREEFEYLGSDDIAGNYRCLNCGYVFTVR